MFEFTIKEKFKPNKKNLQVVEPTKYIITSPITLTIFEYKVNEIKKN